MAKTQTPLTFPEPPKELTGGRFMELLKFFGPGAIMASVTIGTGEVLFASRGGAVFGYTMLWAFVLGAIMKGFQTYSANRYIVLTGEHPFARWADLFPGPRGWFPVLMGVLSVACFPAWGAGVPGTLATLFAQIFGIMSSQAWATILILLAWGMFLAGGYDAMEKVQIAIIAAMVLAVLVAVVAAKPDWLAALEGSFIPQIPHYAPWIAEKYPSIASRPVWVEVVTYLGAIGGGTYDYIGYTGLMREKGWGILGRSDIREIEEKLVALKTGEQVPLSTDPDEVRKGLAWAKAPMMDNIVCYGLLVLFTIGFMVNGANILHTQQQIPAGNDLLTHQVQFLTLIHPVLKYLYYLAVTFALFGTAYGCHQGYVYTFRETFAPVSKTIREYPVSKMRIWTSAYTAIGGLLLTWTGWNPVAIVTPASIVGGVLTGGIWCLAMYYTDRKMLPKPYQMKPWVGIAVIISGIAMTAMGVISVLQYFKVIPG
ncbi:MAG: Nramp family divalent metal transporter [Clostridia bacterium]|nr:Nramp family divalent metal transporter [Clostridia bacterium]